MFRWLQNAQLFGVGVPAISKHLAHIFEEGELDKDVVVSKMEITTQHGAIEGMGAKGSGTFAPQIVTSLMNWSQIVTGSWRNRIFYCFL